MRDRNPDPGPTAGGAYRQSRRLPRRPAIAALTGGKAQFLTELEGAEQWEAEKRLVRSAARGMLADLV